MFALRVRQQGSIPDDTVAIVTDAYLVARYGTGGEEAQMRLREAVVAMR